MMTSAPGPATREQVSGQEKATPAFDLADVCLLVVAARFKAMQVATEDHMPECHGRGSNPLAGKEPVGEAPVKFQSAPLKLHVTPGRQGQTTRDQTDGGRRCGPEVNHRLPDSPIPSHPPRSFMEARFAPRLHDLRRLPTYQESLRLASG